MSEDIKTIIDKLDKLDSRIDNIDITMAKQNVSLEYHIKRSDQADAAIELLDQRVKPLEAHTLTVATVLKFVMYIGTFIAGIAGIYAALK